MNLILNYAFSLSHALFLFLSAPNNGNGTSEAIPWYISHLDIGKGQVITIEWLVIFPIPLFFFLFVFSFTLDVMLGKGNYLVRPFGGFIRTFSRDFGDSLLQLHMHLSGIPKEKGMGLFKTIGVHRRLSFAQWMKTDFVENYENNVQSLAYLGASILIFLIGLRGIKLGITAENPSWVIFGLELECCILILLGVTTFYKPEVPEGHEEEQKEKVDEKAALVAEKKLKETLVRLIESIIEEKKRMYLTKEQGEELRSKFNKLERELKDLKESYNEAVPEDNFESRFHDQPRNEL